MFLSQKHYEAIRWMQKNGEPPKDICTIRDKLDAIDGVIFIGINTTKSCQVSVACTQPAHTELLKILRAITVQTSREKPKLICDLFSENAMTFDLYHIEDAKAALVAFEKAIDGRHFFSEESHFVNSFVLGLDKQRELEKITNGRDMQYVCQPYRDAALSILDALYAHKDLYTCSLVVADRGEKDGKSRTSLMLLCYPSQEGHAKYLWLYETLRTRLQFKALMKLTYSDVGNGFMVAISMNMTAHTPWAADFVLNHCMDDLLTTVQNL